MTDKTRQLFVKCPFYKADTDCSTFCEGCEEGSTIRQTFSSKKQKNEWQQEYCFDINFCWNCPIYGLANEKYEV